MQNVNTGRSVQRMLRHALVLASILGAGFGMPSSAGQASVSFNVSIRVVPPTDSCTALVDTNGRPLVNCQPVTGGGNVVPAAPPAGIQAYRLPDARVKQVGALVEESEENSYAWGEYSSRLIVAGQREYVQMTVTW